MADLAQARAYLEANQPALAREILDGLTETAAGDPEFHYLHGLACGWTGDLDGAVEQLDRAISGGFALYWSLYNRGVFEQRRGNHERALADLLAAIRHEPGHDDVWSFLLDTVLPAMPSQPGWLAPLLGSMAAAMRRQEKHLAAIDQHLAQLRRDMIAAEDRDRDIRELWLSRFPMPPTHAALETDHPVAADSADHRFPRGTKDDNTRHPRFVTACERLFGRKIRHLDLGCSGGGLVWDFLLAGHESYGIEGSDYSLANRRAEWRHLDDHLFTADITKPFRLRDVAGETLRFDLITAWEVLEHITEPDLPGLLRNIDAHLRPGGLFAASVALFRDEDRQAGIEWHVTLHVEEWWHALFETHGFRIEGGLFEAADFPRGSGNPRSHDWDVATDRSLGFHLVCRKPDTSVSSP